MQVWGEVNKVGRFNKAVNGFSLGKRALAFSPGKRAQRFSLDREAEMGMWVCALRVCPSQNDHSPKSWDAHPN